MKLGGDKSVIWDCLVGFRECSSSCADSYIGVMLRKLLVYEGIAVEESGVYLECDEDFQMIPSYLVGREGCMAFEFMGKSFVCTMPEGRKLYVIGVRGKFIVIGRLFWRRVINWCQFMVEVAWGNVSESGCCAM